MKHGGCGRSNNIKTDGKKKKKKEKEIRVILSRRVRFSATTAYCPINLLQDICQGFISSFSILKRTSAGWLLYIGFYFILFFSLTGY